jgi:hypothetical protein
MSIQQRIASDIYRMADRAVTPEQIKSIQAHVVRGVQMGTVPSYVGVPLLNDLNQKMSRIQTAPAQAQAMVQQPPIAQQIVGQAEQGVETLPSGLPEQGMAGGGIVAFAEGGMSDYEMAAQLLSDEDDEDEDYVKAILGDMYSREAGSSEEEDDGIDGLMATQTRESMSMQEGDQPPRGVQRERTSVTGPAGLESLLKMIEQKESGGRGDYDKYGNLLTSPAGAQGRMQVMPATSRDPGFGIRPAREGDVEDLARVGREYYTKMLDRYQDPKLAAIAYNWGPGNTDKWISAGADMKRLPAETRNYVANMAQGGAVRFDVGGIADLTPEEIKEAMRRRIKMEGAREAFSKMPQGPAAPIVPSAPAAAQPSFLEAAKSALSRIRPGVGGLGVGLPALFHTGELNANEDAELARRRAMPPTIGIPAAAPAAGVATLPSAGAGRGRQGGPNLEESKRAAFEREIGATQDAEDMDAGLNALPVATKEEPTKEAAPKEGGIRELLDKYREDVREQRETDKYLSLLSAGLGMMGGTSPFAGANIGQGALQGVKTYQQAAQLRGADERALLSGELGLKKYEDLSAIRKAGIERQKAADEANLQLRRDRLVQNQQKMYAEQLQDMIETAQREALARYKGELIGDKKDQLLAQAKTELTQSPEYRQLYRAVYGRDPYGGQGWGIKELGSKK